MQKDLAPEFDLQRPFASAVAVIRTVLFSPRSFYVNFKVEGPLKEPAAFVLLVGTVSGILGAALALSSNLLFGDLDAGDLRAAVVDAVLFALLSPVGVGVVAGVYLLSIRTFVRKMSGFREVYRMAAYAAAALILAWIPVLGAFAFTYALIVLMGIGIHSVYGTSFLTTVVTAVVGFVLVASVLIWLIITGVAS
ncbi:MAG TPA: YIP1 family protein [Rubrobacter sp.]|nr:YIP1 family protein [Rubrobacter sp.]